MDKTRSTRGGGLQCPYAHKKVNAIL